ncbi:ATP-binding protein [Fulvimarina sp. 2208YS6-2-32]|uniref:histidine kinase n=1 Tax=Fulvimarina uroteuthidis TaxID=3098149 RepID=A0ABU5I2V4_9HYPH|nr:ATP-binding protein [Fulvimarina sp. 2208YS6-2-32]MDY8109697.1 ATP-binding protein [Fulvimarina sp. 2208YS6-2-32]
MRRLLFFGGCLILVAAGLALFGNDNGRVALLVLFSLLAAIGIVALFGLALGFLSLSAKTDDGSAARSFLDGARQGAVFVDRKGAVVYANRSYGRLIGKEEGASVPPPVQLLARHAGAAEDVYWLAKAAREKNGGHREFRLDSPLSGEDSHARWYRVSVRPIEARTGSLQAWQIADITADRREEEASFRTLQDAIDYLDKAPVGFFASDADLNLTYLNATLATWLDTDLGDFQPGRTALTEFLPKAARTELVARTRPLEEGAIQTIELDLTTGKGRILPVKMIVQKARERDGSAGLRAIILSETSPQRSHAEAAGARLNRFFNAAPMAIASLNDKFESRRSNPAFARLFGEKASREAVPFLTLLNDESAERMRERLQAASEGEAEIAPVDVTMRGDKPRSARIYLNVIPDRDTSEDETIILYAVDITDQRALEDQFATAQKMQAVGNLAGGIAHDFNNVLTVITASVDFLLMNQKPGDPAFQDLLLIKQSANRAASLVRQLLAYSRRQTMRPKMLSLTDVVADLDLLLKRIAGDRTKLERRHARDLWPVMADIGQFEQVITNLVGNARDAMPNGGTISIATRNVDAAEAPTYEHPEMPKIDYVLVEVADTGTGMPADVAERIFEPFFTTKEIGKGTGLGLSMVYGIIKQSNGFIYVDSTEGKGTVFRIFLPRYVPDVAVTMPDQTKPTGTPEKIDLSGTATILLVEDEDYVRAGSVRALKLKGYDVHEADSGLDALDVLEALDGKIDLVVSDVVMPEMDGPTLLREMRKIRPDMKFVFVSGYAEEAFAKNLPVGEKFGFLSKPFSQKELAMTVKQMLESKD